MPLKSEIKKAINLHSKKYRALKVYGIEEHENLFGEITVYIEVRVARKRKNVKK